MKASIVADVTTAHAPACTCPVLYAREGVHMLACPRSPESLAAEHNPPDPEDEGEVIALSVRHDGSPLMARVESSAYRFEQQKRACVTYLQRCGVDVYPETQSTRRLSSANVLSLAVVTGDQTAKYQIWTVECQLQAMRCLERNEVLQAFRAYVQAAGYIGQLGGAASDPMARLDVQSAIGQAIENVLKGAVG